MIEKESQFLTKKQRVIEEALLNLGYHKPMARVLLFFLKNEKGFSRDIEHEFNLRQPEVSTCTKILREQGIITSEDVKGNGKGRPCIEFQRNTSSESLLNEIIKEKEQELLKSQELISNLKNELAQLE